jgi:propanediol dehydratase large subunit
MTLFFISFLATTYASVGAKVAFNAGASSSAGAGLAERYFARHSEQ